MKRTNKRIISLVLSVLMLLSLLPAGMFAMAEDAMNSENTVYVDQANGLDTNDGCIDHPVKTIEQAVAMLEDGDKTADGYVYLLDDYSAVYNGEPSGSECVTSILPAHTRHIIITGNVGKKPTWELRFKPLIYTGFFKPTSNRHGAASLYPLTNGPVTFDAVTVHSTVDKENYIQFPTTTTYTIPADHPNEKYRAYAGKTITFEEGSYLYKDYNITDNGDGTLTLTPNGDAKYYLLINTLRWVTKGYFATTANNTLTWDTTAETDRQHSAFPTTKGNAGHCQVVAQKYFYFNAPTTLNGTGWNSCYAGVEGVKKDVQPESEIILTIGANSDVTGRFLIVPTKDTPASTKVTYVIEKQNFDWTNVKYTIFGDTDKSPKTSPEIVCDFTVVVKASGAKFAGGLTESSTATGKGTYNLVIDNPSVNFSAANQLMSGFNSLQFTNVGEGFTFDLGTLPAVGYNLLRVAEGDVLNLNGSATRAITLDIESTGANRTFDVLKNVSQELFNAITLSEAAEDIGELAYNAETRTVSYLLDSGTVAYAKGDAEEEIVLPESETVIVGKSITLSAPSVTTLEDGREFIGWKDEGGKLYRAGDSLKVTAQGTFATLTAVWEIVMTFTTGYESEDVFQESVSASFGEKFVLPNDLRGTVVNDGKYDLVFYGWEIDGKIRFAGETLKMDEADLSATAVWIPALYVAPSYLEDDADGTYAKPYSSITAVQAAMKLLFADESNADYVAGAIVLKETTLWNFSAIGKATLDFAKPILYTAISSDIALNLYLPATGNDFYLGKYNLFDYLTLRAINYNEQIRFRTYNGTEASPAFMYFGPDVITDAPKDPYKKGPPITSVSGGVPFGYTEIDEVVSAGTYMQWSTILLQPSGSANIHVYGGAVWDGLRMFNDAQTVNVYVGSNGNDQFPYFPRAQFENQSAGVLCVWNYYQYGGKVDTFNIGIARTDKANVHGGAFNMYLYGGVVTSLIDSLESTQTTTSRNPLPLKKNIYVEGYNGAINVIHNNPELRVSSAVYGESYYKTASGVYYYSAIYPNGFDSATIIDSNITFSGAGLYLRSSANITYYQDANSVVSGNIVATKDRFVEDANTPNKFNAVTVSLANPQGEAAYIFDGDNWKTPAKISYVTGHNGVTVTETTAGAVGASLPLSSQLRGTTVIVGGQAMTFYGWMVDEKYYDAGDVITMSEGGATATAIWVPAIYVDGLNGDDETANGTKANPYKSGNAALQALKDLLAERGNTDAAGAVYLLNDSVFTPIADSLYIDVSKSDSELLALDVPVLFTANNSDKVLTFALTTGHSQIRFSGSCLFDKVTVDIDSLQYADSSVRILPARDLYFGIHVKNTGFIVDNNMMSALSADYKFYNGSFAHIMLGDGLGYAQVKTHLYFGNGSVDSAPAATNVYANGQADTNAVITAEFRSGTVTNMYVAKSTNQANHKFSGDLIYRLYRGISVTKIFDYSTNYLVDKSFFINMSRTLVFDGFVGAVQYHHGAAAAITDFDNELPNGLDAIAFVNGANVTFTNQSPRVVARSNGFGNVYVDSTSSYNGKTIVGVYYDHANDAEKDGAALTPVADTLYTWDGAAWTSGTYGKALGAQRRTTAPHGIRFGFIGSTAALEAILGQAVAEKGVLLIPTYYLDSSELNINTANVLKVEANVAFKLDQPNVFTAMLVDDYDNSNSTWLDEWAEVNFTARAYFKLADGTVIYSDSVERSVASISDALTETLPA